jgi:Na+(H+)/acetate symporter ActP
MVLLYIAVTGFGLFITANADKIVNPDAGIGSNQPASTDEALFMGVIYAVLGVVLAIVFAVSLFTPRRFWGWVYNLVMICFGLTSCCFWPATIPLLIFWIKPEVRAWYKNEPSQVPPQQTGW